jgi:hypothetical protein
MRWVTSSDADLRSAALELLFADAKSFYADLAAERKFDDDPGRCERKCQPRPTLRECVARNNTVSTSAASTIFDFDEWLSEVASRKSPNGTISFITTVPGELGFEFVVGSGAREH